MKDMRTLGGRIVAAQNGDRWYDDPGEFENNYERYEDGSYHPKDESKINLNK